MVLTDDPDQDDPCQYQDDPDLDDPVPDPVDPVPACLPEAALVSRLPLSHLPSIKIEHWG